MRLATKLTLKTGLMVCVMVIGTAVAHHGIHAAEAITAKVLEVQNVGADGMAQEAQRRQRLAELEEVREANASVMETLWVATGLASGIGLVFCMVFARRIAAGFDRVAERADAIASGDLSLKPLDLDDTTQVELLAVAMNRMQTKLCEMIGALAGSSTSLGLSADEMRTASEGVQRKMDQQSRQTQQAAAAMAEMSASIAEVSRHTQDAAQTARDAAQTARDGGDVVKSMLAAMDRQWTRVSATADMIGLLNTDTGKISGIVNVIDEIAKKTNLLALNAAIEAARAGEQGRGFAVVAGEVRRLAESTARATSEIGGMIAGVQQRAGEAWDSVDNGRKGVAALVETTKTAGESLERIIGMAERVERMIAQIAIATSQQSAAADQSSGSLDEIHSLSHGTLSELAVSAKSVEGLRATAGEIERQVERFLLAPKESSPKGRVVGHRPMEYVGAAG